MLIAEGEIETRRGRQSGQCEGRNDGERRLEFPSREQLRTEAKSEIAEEGKGEEKARQKHVLQPSACSIFWPGHVARISLRLPAHRFLLSLAQ